MTTADIGVPDLLQRDYARLTGDALDVLGAVERLIVEGEQLQPVACYLASNGLDENDLDYATLQATGELAFSNVMHLVYDRLHRSGLISGVCTSSGRAEAEATVAGLRGRAR